MPDTPEGDRIAKVLSRAGVASRREAERMITDGRVAVNGRVIDSPALNITPADRVTVDGQPVAAPEPPRLWLYYKPEGLVTSAADEQGRATVFENLPETLPRVMSIGRLDLNSEGLLLLTNDGELKRRLELPSTGWLRKYRVRVKGNPTDPDVEPLRRGITVEGENFQPMTVVIDRHQGANAWLTVALREGRNREIRRAMTAVGLTVNRLIRVSYGPFRLGDLQPGAVEEVRARVLREQLGLGDDEAAEATQPARKRGPTVARRAPTGPATPETTRETSREKKPAGAAALSKSFRAATTKPGPTKPRPTKPGTTKPGPTKPGLTKPATTRPATSTAPKAPTRGKPGPKSPR